MLRRTFAAVIIVLGLTLIGLGVASATLWRPDDHVTATMPAPTTAVILVQPGVLGLVNENVTLTATAASEDLPVVLTFARAGDVLAWVGADTARTDVTGLSDWHNLATTVVEGTQTTVPDPRTAELWTTVLEGTGTLTVDLTPDSGQIIMMAATDGAGAAPALSLTWQVDVVTPYMVPLITIGSVLALIGLAWLSYQLLVARELRQREIAQDEIEKKAERQALETQIFSTDKPMTRRQLREMQRRFKEQDPRHADGGPVRATAGLVGAGVLPGVSDPGHFRALRHIPLEDSSEIPAIREQNPPPPESENPVPAVTHGEIAEEPLAAPPAIEAPQSRESDPATTQSPARTSWRALWDIKEDPK